MNQNFSTYILQKRKENISILKDPKQQLKVFFTANFFKTRFIFGNGKKLNLKSTKNRKQNVGKMRSIIKSILYCCESISMDSYLKLRLNSFNRSQNDGIKKLQCFGSDLFRLVKVWLTHDFTKLKIKIVLWFAFLYSYFCIILAKPILHTL